MWQFFFLLIQNRASEWRKKHTRHSNRNAKETDIDDIQEIPVINNSTILNAYGNKTEDIPITRSIAFQDPENLNERDV